MSFEYKRRLDLIPALIFSLATKSSYHEKYKHIVGETKAEKIEAPQKSFGLVSASLKRDRRTIEETQREMREKKLKKKSW